MTRSMSALAVLRDRPDVRRQLLLSHGALLAAFAVHTWASSTLVAKAPAGVSVADAAFYGGLISGIAVFAAALIVGWICGGLLMQRGGCEARNARGFLRRLALVGSLTVVCTAFGAYPLAGALIMAIGCAGGFVGRRTLSRARR